MSKPVFDLGQQVTVFDLDDVAKMVRDSEQAVLMSEYTRQNTATTAAIRYRDRLAGCLTADGRALELTSRKIGDLSGIFAYLHPAQAARLVSFHLYADRDGADAAGMLDGLTEAEVAKVYQSWPKGSHVTPEHAARLVEHYATGGW